MNVIIGVDPHKATHTAVALDGDEGDLGEIQVGANPSQLKRLLAWAAPFEERTWAIEGAGGCGYLLSQQLVAAGVDVVDVPATLAARVRVLGSGKSNKNDPNDARSIAVAALRTLGLTRVRPSDHASVLRLLQTEQSAVEQPNPHHLPAPRAAGRARPGRISQETQGDRGRAAPRHDHAHHGDAGRTPRGRPRASRGPAPCRRAARRDPQAHHRSRRRVRHDVTDITGVGPIVAAMAIGYTGDVRRFATRHHYAAYTGTAPIEVSSGPRVVHRLFRRGNRQFNHAMHLAALSQIRYPDTDGGV